MKYSDIILPSNKKFGLFFTSVFLIISFIGYYYYSYNISISFFVLSIIFLVISLIKPKILLPLNKLWMFFGYILNLIISPLVLGLIFFIILTPLALVLKFLKRDELGLNNINQDSFWKIRQNKKIEPEYFNNQF